MMTARQVPAASLCTLARHQPLTFLPKPAQVVCDEVLVVAAGALHDDHPLLIALLAERLGSPGVALSACEQHHELALLEVGVAGWRPRMQRRRRRLGLCAGRAAAAGAGLRGLLQARLQPASGRYLEGARGCSAWGVGGGGGRGPHRRGRPRLPLAQLAQLPAAAAGRAGINQRVTEASAGSKGSRREDGSRPPHLCRSLRRIAAFLEC